MNEFSLSVDISDTHFERDELEKLHSIVFL